jgi:hypothetical protein
MTIGRPHASSDTSSNDTVQLASSDFLRSLEIERSINVLVSE